MVDGNGQVLDVESRTNTDSYKVFVEDPLKGGQTVIAGPGAGNAQSPNGWLAGTPTTFNIQGNKAVAVQNLFYLNNLVHVTLYRHGFNEANGNFQTNNFGNGGLGNDPVSAEAQDGSGTDNANFSTPTDGSAPRMQMYVWNSNPQGLVTVGAANYGAYPFHHLGAQRAERGRQGRRDRQ